VDSGGRRAGRFKRRNISDRREPGVEAGGAWRFRPQDAAITVRIAAKYPSDGGFHPRRPTPLDWHGPRGRTLGARPIPSRRTLGGPRVRRLGVRPMPSRRTLPTGILPFGRSMLACFGILPSLRQQGRLDWHGPHPSQSIDGHALNPINRESGVEAGGAWRFRLQNAAITIRTAAKYPSDGGFHPRRPTPLDWHGPPPSQSIGGQGMTNR